MADRIAILQRLDNIRKRSISGYSLDHMIEDERRIRDQAKDRREVRVRMFHQFEPVSLRSCKSTLVREHLLFGVRRNMQAPDHSRPRDLTAFRLIEYLMIDVIGRLFF